MPGLFGRNGGDPLRHEPIRGLLDPAESGQVKFGLLAENPLGSGAHELNAAFAQFMPSPAAPDRLPFVPGQAGVRPRDPTLRMERVPVPRKRGRPLDDCAVIANEIRRTKQILELALGSVTAGVDIHLPEMEAKLAALERQRNATGDPVTRKTLEAEIGALRKDIKVMNEGVFEASDRATEARNRLIALLSDRESRKCP